MTDCIVVLVTAAGTKEAEKIADALVRGKLAACVNILPGVKSVYRWGGKVCTDKEVLLLVKSARILFPRIREAVQALHSYEVPEIIAWPIADGSEKYIHWLKESVI
ncbi:divalent-cation tolerance protein CutA [bacterium]|nr:divalent-cation tolerance protein CutA [bacterium]